MDLWKTLSIQCKGGLNTSTDTLSYQPGEATQLVNYEPGIYGGYRRISGYQIWPSGANFYNAGQLKYVEGGSFITSGAGAEYPIQSITIPGEISYILGGAFITSKVTVAASGAVLGVCVYNGNPGGVIACNNIGIFFSSGTGWSTIAVRTNPNRFKFAKYFNGNTRCVAMCDGNSPAAKWDGTNYTLINGTGAPTNPRFATYFNNCLVLSGYTSNGGVCSFSLSVPNEDTDFSGVNGAIEIDVHDEIVAIQNFRQILYIFCERSIWQLTGTDSTNYAISPVATGIGCLAYDSLQECNGDLVYLSADGIRTLSGTMKLNDVELGDLSKPIIDIANSVWENASSNPDNICSCIVRRKNQYRLFYRTDNNSAGDAMGIIGAIRPGKQTMTQFGSYISYWEWAQILGIQANCADSDFIDGTEVIVHGGVDGIVYQQEIGNSFNGNNISSTYTTAPLQLDDPETRKLLQKLTIYLHLEGNAQITVQPQYDFNNTFLNYNPAPIALPCTTYISAYGSGVYGTATYGVGTAKYEALTNVQGSGKIVQLSFTSNDQNAPHSIQGVSLQYRPLGRR